MSIVGIPFRPDDTDRNLVWVGNFIIDYAHIDDAITYLEYWKKWREQENEGN